MLKEITWPSGTFVHQLPFGGSSGVVFIVCFLSLSLLLCLGPCGSIVLRFESSHQCRLVVCIVVPIHF